MLDRLAVRAKDFEIRKAVRQGVNRRGRGQERAILRVPSSSKASLRGTGRFPSFSKLEAIDVVSVSASRPRSKA